MSDLFLEYKKRPGPAELTQLLERHRDAVYSLCYRVLRHPQDAEDACQDVLLEVSRQVDAIEQPEGFAGWLYRTTLHTALDVKRRRGRRKSREQAAASAGRPEQDPDAHEELLRGLAGLDETSRMLVVEHYLAQRPLRELANERGCSEVAVWKRIRTAKERLRRTLGSAAFTALDGHGGLAMAVKVGIKMAIAAPLLLLATAGMVVVLRQPEPPPVRKEVQKKAPLPPPAIVVPEPPPRQETPPTAPKPFGRKPWPLAYPKEEGSGAAREAWLALGDKRLDLEFEDVPFATVVESIATMLGIRFTLLVPGKSEHVSFKVKDLTGDGCLRLLLGPRELAYEIRPDGTVVIAPKDDLRGGYEQIGRTVQYRQLEVNQVHQELEKGWEGVDNVVDLEAVAASDLRSKTVLLPQGTTSWNDVMDRLRTEYGQGVIIDAAVASTVEDACRRPFLSVVDEIKMGTLLDRLARELNLSWCLLERNTAFLGSAADVARERAQAEQRLAGHRRDLERLEKVVQTAGPIIVSDLLDAVSRSHRLKLMPEEAVWESSSTVTVAAGSTLRQALDQLKPLGFRWAIRNGSLYVVK